MIPPYGHRHEPVLAPPADFAFRFAGATRALLALRGIRPSTTGVRVADGLLHVRFGRRRIRCLVTDVEGARVEPGVRRRGGEALVLRTCSGNVAVLRLRAARPDGPRRPRELALTVENPAALVAQLGSLPGLPAVRDLADRQAR